MALKLSESVAAARLGATNKGGGPNNHTKAQPLTNIDLDKPGRLRVGHLMTLFSVSHSTLYKHIKHGQIPAPDGHDGNRPFWRTETIRSALAN